MKLIVGLGNPGAEYQATRHNIGRLIVEHAAQREALVWSKKKSLKACIATTAWNGEPVCLAYPETMMNVSGEAVGRLAKHFEISVSTGLLILVDDIYLSFGRLRLRPSGSAGGHNGLKSIQEALKTENYARLRIGVGAPGSAEAMRDYVLDSFTPAEKKVLKDILDQGWDASQAWAHKSTEEAMRIVNASKGIG